MGRLGYGCNPNERRFYLKMQVEVIFEGSAAAVYWANGSESAGVPPQLQRIVWEPFDEVYTPAALSSLIERENAAALEILISQLRSPMGVVPFAGDAFDVFFRANRRNVALLREHFARTGYR